MGFPGGLDAVLIDCACCVPFRPLRQLPHHPLEMLHGVSKLTENTIRIARHIQLP